ncbi:hypothetical protein LTR66_011215 [Elasticomyces elasticus]|nr:hypothetical protein LTR66_011215 [Elasticomyces elasticus]
MTVPADPADLRSALDRDGYVLIPSVLSPTQLETLRSACQRSAALARAGKWPFIRTLPKQFPPWPSDPSHGIWGVQHLLHPDLPDHDTFARSYFAPHIIDAVTEILACQKDALVMELYNLLVRPDEDFALRWHRDDIGPAVSPREEEELLQRPILHAQWNLALYDDASLIAVPGSHKRARTAAERDAHPFEDDMPGQQAIKMEAGDVVFYNNNVLHRGVYSSDVERMTLHGSMGVVGADEARARNVLQHGVGEWVDQCDFTCLDKDSENGMGSLAEDMKGRLIAMGRRGNVGYSQVG